MSKKKPTPAKPTSTPTPSREDLEHALNRASAAYQLLLQMEITGQQSFAAYEAINFVKEIAERLKADLDATEVVGEETT